MKVWLLQPFFKCVKKKKNQTACQTPECNPKEDNDALALFWTDINAQITNIILKQNNTKRCKHL